MRESTIERHLARRVRESGGMSRKFVSPARRDVPDRIVMYPGASLTFVECKRTGEEPTPGQLREHTRLRNLGFHVEVVDSIEQVEALIVELTA